MCKFFMADIAQDSHLYLSIPVVAAGVAAASMHPICAD